MKPKADVFLFLKHRLHIVNYPVVQTVDDWGTLEQVLTEFMGRERGARGGRHITTKQGTSKTQQKGQKEKKAL